MCGDRQVPAQEFFGGFFPRENLAKNPQIQKKQGKNRFKKKKEVLPGFEPGLQGSKPWVLTNYTIEPHDLKKGSTGI